MKRYDFLLPPTDDDETTDPTLQADAAHAAEMLRPELAEIKAALVQTADTLAAEGDLAIKAGARHSSGDVQIIQEIYDTACDLCELAEALGADAGMADEDESGDEAAAEQGGEVELKGISQAERDDDDLTVDFATVAALIDVEINTIANILGDFDEDDEDDATKAQTAQERAMFANMGTRKGGGSGKPTGGQGGLYNENSNGERTPQSGREVPKGKASLQKKKAKIENRLTDIQSRKRRLAELESEFTTNRGKLSVERLREIRKEIASLGKPGKAKKSIDSLAIFSVDGGAIKALDGDAIGGFGVLFGDADNHDLSAQRDYFTKSTDYWLDKFGWPRPITYHHGLDEDTSDDPIIGSWSKAIVKPEGIWLEGQLDRAYKYHGAIKELIKRGYLKLSSDSAPQWVQRERQPNGANEVKRWPLLTASATVTPAEPRLSGLSFKALMADLGLSDSDDSPEANDTTTSDSADGQKALGDRARRLLLEIELLELEETAL